MSKIKDHILTDIDPSHPVVIATCDLTTTTTIAGQNHLTIDKLKITIDRDHPIMGKDKNIHQTETDQIQQTDTPHQIDSSKKQRTRVLT